MGNEEEKKVRSSLVKKKTKGKAIQQLNLIYTAQHVQYRYLDEYIGPYRFHPS